jgi:hypothetical protein
LSDDPEAQIFRENNRKKMAKMDGRYNPDRWVSQQPGGGSGGGGYNGGSGYGMQGTNTNVNKTGGAGDVGGRKRGRDDAAYKPPEDDEVRNFLEAF